MEKINYAINLLQEKNFDENSIIDIICEGLDAMATGHLNLHNNETYEELLDIKHEIERVLKVKPEEEAKEDNFAKVMNILSEMYDKDRVAMEQIYNMENDEEREKAIFAWGDKNGIK